MVHGRAVEMIDGLGSASGTLAVPRVSGDVFMVLAECRMVACGSLRLQQGIAEPCASKLSRETSAHAPAEDLG